MAELETVFGVPVIESYGMTEAAHQMASNPLPPRPRFPGSVGVAAGPEIAIMDPGGELLANGAIGEVVIRGANVTAGYEANPAANAAAFADGWFRTGDQGVLDRDGYLRLTGRLKEIINRGGEKISPLEVDTALMDHPAIAQLITFAAPHPIFGEEVAVAVVLREGEALDEEGLRRFAATKLAAYKAPSRVVFVDEIPKGATGKLQRIGLAEKLGLT
jgi:acyl-CoA synthetase (AMP-forming)/AMP-acid ligase II